MFVEPSDKKMCAYTWSLLPSISFVLHFTKVSACDGLVITKTGPLLG